MDGMGRSSAPPSAAVSPAPRILLRACVLCLCSTWCRSVGPSGAVAFMAPSTAGGGTRLHSCSSELARQDTSVRATATRRSWRACSMLSSDTADLIREQRSRGRVPKSDFVVYTGPEASRGRKLRPDQQAKRDKEQRLGKRIRKCARLEKLKKQMVDQWGEDAVTREAWAEAAGETVESLQKTLETGANAKQALVVLNLGMVYNIVDGYVQSMKNGHTSSGASGAEFTKTDMVQEATMGLICAVERFDPARGFRFATYAQWWVRKYLNEGLQNHNRMVRIPVSLAYRISKVNRVRNQLHLELGRAPTRTELASEAGCTLEQLETCLEQGAFRVSSLDHLSGFGRVQGDGGVMGQREEGFLNEVDMFSPAGSGGKHGSATPQGAEFLQMSLREDLKDALFRLLDATERECLVLRYGLQDGVPKSVEETAEIMEFCESDDVRIITLQAMAKLREGCLPGERKKLMSYLSLYEPDTLKGSKVGDTRRWSDASTSEGDDAEEDDEDKVWDFSNHCQEELQHELTRYLKKHRIDKEGGATKGSKWSKGALAKGDSRRTTRGANSKVRAESARQRGERTRKLERRREMEARQRELEAEQEKERLLRPIPVGNGAGSAVIGDLEPKPNSREADQLEHLSRLLWDGEEEPADFVLSYSKPSGRSTIQ